MSDYNIESLRKMKLPEHLTPEWDLSWGSFVDIRLLNSPDLKTNGFHIKVSLATGHILGCEKVNEYSEREGRWFGGEALLYQHNQEEYASSAHIKLFDRSYIMLCDALWHDTFEGCDDGELPATLSEERFNKIFNGKWFSELYHHIKQNLSDEGMVEFVENDIPKMKLPKQFFPDYKLAWGKYVTFWLDNGPACHKIDKFSIQLNMETNEVIGHGHANRDDVLSRWFNSWEVAIYDGYAADRSYDGVMSIWGEEDKGTEDWCICCHNMFEDLLDGELPDGATGDDLWNALGDGKAIYELYHHIKQNLSDEGMVEFVENDIPKMKLPKQFFPDYKLAWGKYVTFWLDNGPACHKIDKFSIQLNMETNEVIGHGHANRDDVLSRWFNSWEVAIYDGYAADRSYDGVMSIWGEEDKGTEDWCICCHNMFEDLLDGELPDGATGDDLWNALGDGKAIYELYHHIKTNGE